MRNILTLVIRVLTVLFCMGIYLFFLEGCVIKLLSNLEFKKYTNGVLKTYTYQLNQHINKVSEALVLSIHW
jgi:hypothetical protein